jgi:tetratricopeptide (TPR) repeat protein
VAYSTRVARGLPGAIVGLAVIVGAWGARSVRAQAQTQAPLPGAAAAEAEPLPAYLAELERTRRLPPETASLERLRERLAAAEESLARGDARAAASGLYELVESPRWSPWHDTVPFQQAELTLGRALLRGGATLSAERYLVRVLRRGPDKTYFVPAHRAMVDLALETRQVARVRDLLAGLPTGGRLPPDSAAEQTYLDGRARYQAGDLEGAATRLAQVPRSSRLYAGAAYFRGLIAARLGHFDKARGAFCEILPGKNQGNANAVTDAVSGMVSGETLAFTIDGRYFQLQDLARLALGRIAHERDRYDEAYYFYFSVPEDSDRLAEALFEAAWSMYQKGEVRAAETRVWTARAANTGVSAIIDSRGRVRARTRIFERGWLVEDVPLRRAPRGGSFYARNGDVFVGICWAALAIFGFVAWTRRREVGRDRGNSA